MSMTDDDKTLVERLKDEWPYMFIGDDEWLDTDALDGQRTQAASRIEALSEENERLREALLQMKRMPNYIRKDDNRKEMLKIINAALEETE